METFHSLVFPQGFYILVVDSLRGWSILDVFGMAVDPHLPVQSLHFIL